MVKGLVLKPVVQKIDGGWQAGAGLYEDSTVYVSFERFNAYDNKQEAWDNAKQASQEHADKHNKTCGCSKKMTVGSY